MKKKETFVALGVACIAVMSLSVLVYAVTWTPEEMADWMYNIGRHKIWRTNWILYNEIGPKLEDIRQLTQGTWSLSGNSFGWANIKDALEDVKTEIAALEDEVNININPKLEDIYQTATWAHYYSYSNSIVEGNMHDWSSLAEALDDIKNEIEGLEGVQPMLHVEATAKENRADTNNKEAALICVRVMYAGEVVSGLTIDNFALDWWIVPWWRDYGHQGPNVRIDSVFSWPDGEGYFLSIEPTATPSWPSGNWGPGQYVLALTVNTPYGIGHILVTLVVDEPLLG